MKKNNKLDENSTQNLPKGWEIKKLGEVCEVQRGLTYSGKDTVDFSNNVVLRATNINLENNSLDFSELKYLRNDFVVQEKYKLKKGSLLICFSSGSKSHLGKVALIDKEYEYSFGGFIGQLNPNNVILSEYLFFSLISNNYKTYISELTDGVNINNLKIKDLQQFQIPLPPLSEQKRIVSKLDTLFAEIEALETKTKQNLKNAKELFQSYLQGVFDPSTHSGQGSKGDDCSTLSSSKWEEKKLGEVVDFFNGFAFKSRDNVEISNTQVIRMGNLYQNRLSLDRKPAFVPDNFAVEYNRYLLKENDLIISLTGTSGKEDYGYTVKIPKTKKQLLLNQRIAKFVIIDNSVLCKDFLFQFVLSRTFLDELYKTANGTRQANLSTEAMKDLSISFPSIDVQKQIVEKLDALSAETKKLESIYQEKLLSLAELKKSILNKAFKGEL